MISLFQSHKKSIVYILSFFIPLLIAVVLCADLGIVPFGDRSLAVWDANTQYMDYLAYLKSILNGQSDPFYSFSQTLGGGISGFIAYYLTSPFNLLVLFFSEENLPFAFGVIYILKLCSCSTAFQFYQIHHKTTSLFSVVLSVSYAFIAYNAAYGFNIMWLDAVMILPLLANSIERLITDRKFLPYTLLLAWGLIMNYYIGFSLCLFSALYYAITLCFYGAKKRRNLPLFAAASIAAAALAAVQLIPVLYSLSGGKGGFSLDTLKPGVNFNLLAFPAQFFSCNFTIMDIMNSSLPKIFCGFTALLLVGIFFLNSKIFKKDKLYFASLFLVLILCFWITPLDLIWHGLNTPGGSPYRYSFIFSFLFLVAASKGISCVKFINKKDLFALFLICMLFILSAAVFDDVETKYILFDICILLFFSFSWLFYKKGRLSLSLFILFLSAVQLFDISHNTKVTWNYLLNNTQLSTSEYQDYYREMSAILDQLDTDTSFYRMEIARVSRRNYNDAMLFQYNGLSHYSSTEKVFLEEWENFLGISSWNETELPTLAADSLMGIKYIVSSDALQKPYPAIFSSDANAIYQNPYALPLAMTANSDIDRLTLKKDFDSFTGMNQIFTALSGLDEPIFTEASWTAEYSADRLDISLSITESDPLYVSFPAGAQILSPAAIYVDGTEIASYYGLQDNTIVPLGQFEPGDTVQISLLSDDRELPTPNVLLYYENPEVLANHFHAIQQQEISLQVNSSSDIRITVSASDNREYLFLTIPYDSGWNAYVNGESVPTLQVLDTFLVVPISGSACEIQLSFFPPGLKAGIAISITTAALLLLVSHLKRYRKKS